MPIFGHHHHHHSDFLCSTCWSMNMFDHHASHSLIHLVQWHILICRHNVGVSESPVATPCSFTATFILFMLTWRLLTAADPWRMDVLEMESLLPCNNTEGSLEEPSILVVTLIIPIFHLTSQIAAITVHNPYWSEANSAWRFEHNVFVARIERLPHPWHLTTLCILWHRSATA